MFTNSVPGENNVVRISLIILLFIVAVNAFAGGYYGLAGAKNIPPEWLEGSPFRSYFIPSLFLFVVVGGSCLLAAIAVLRRWAIAGKLAMLTGVIMLGWIIAQVSIIGYVSWLQPAIAISGLATILLSTRLRQSSFK
jgi:hypothetical protein